MKMAEVFGIYLMNKGKNYENNTIVIKHFATFCSL